MHEELERLRQNQKPSEVGMLRLRKQGSFSSKNADHDKGNGNISEREGRRRENGGGLKEKQIENVSTGIKVG